MIRTRAQAFPLHCLPRAIAWDESISRGRGSLEETKYHLLLAKDLDYLPEADYNDLIDRYNVAGKMLNGLINKIKKEVQGSS